MAFNIVAALRDLLSQAENEEPETLSDQPADDGNPDAPDTGSDENPTEGDDLQGDDAAASGEDAEGAAPEVGADGAVSSEERPTIPDSEVPEADLRDALNRLAAENEALKRALEEAGIDLEEDVVDDIDTEDETPEYDDDAAQADIDAQKSAIASLKG